ncbi:MAG TPA: hypothetical protein VKB13_09135 [Gaiellaceae bacterium]|nr:hypothetical protein [Gaiellaceae bacterium]
MVRLMESGLTTTAERPVFVASDDRRARWLRYAAALAVALACAWLVALAFGMLGIGRLPGLSLPVIAHGAEKAPAAKTAVVTSKSAADVPGSSATTARSAAAPTLSHAARTGPSSAAALTSGPKARTKRHPTTKAKVTSKAPTTAVRTAPAAAPATAPRQGWARRGLSAPPGRAAHAEPKAKPTAARGQTRKQAVTDTTTAPAPPVATPVPPGQQKKAEDPNHQS